MLDGTMLASAAVGTLTDMALRKGHEKILESLGDTPPNATDLLFHLLQSVHRLEQIYHAQRRTSAWQSIQIYPGYHTEYPASAEYPYNMLFVRAATIISMKIPGIGDMSAMLYPGWNDLNLPPDTTIGLPQNAPGMTSLIFREAMQSYPSLTQFSGQNQGGYIPLVLPPTQTNAGADTVLTFAERVGTVTIQNNSGVSLYYGFDTVAGPGGLQLTPGQAMTEAKSVSALHIYTSTAQNINGNASGNIVVLGEQ